MATVYRYTDQRSSDSPQTSRTEGQRARARARSFSVSVSVSHSVGFFTILDEDPEAVQTALGIKRAAGVGILGIERDIGVGALGIDGARGSDGGGSTGTVGEKSHSREESGERTSKRNRLNPFSKVLKGVSLHRRSKSQAGAVNGGNQSEWSALSEVGGNLYAAAATGSTSTPESSVNATSSLSSPNATSSLRGASLSLSRSRSLPFPRESMSHFVPPKPKPNRASVAPLSVDTTNRRRSVVNVGMTNRRSVFDTAAPRRFAVNAGTNFGFMKRNNLPTHRQDALRSASVRLRRQSVHFHSISSTHIPNGSMTTNGLTTRPLADKNDRLMEALDFACDPVVTIDKTRFSIPANKPGVERGLLQERRNLVACHIDNDLFWVDMSKTSASGLSQSFPLASVEEENLEYGFSHSLRSLSVSSFSVFSETNTW